MSDTVNAVVTRTRGINRDRVHVPHGGIIEDMAADQFGEWNRLQIVERATAEQVAAHREAIAQAEAEAAAMEAERSSAAPAAAPKPAPKPAAKKASKTKMPSSPRPSRAKKPVTEEPPAPASPLTAPVLGAVTAEPKASDAPEASA